MDRMHIIRNTVAVLGSFALVASASGAFAAMAVNAQKEIQTAAEHAGFAASAKDVKDTHMHLHHAINCIVGPTGDGFDSAFADPCKGMGNGALNDVGNKETKAMIGQALSLAKVGIQIDGKVAAQDTAKAVRQLLADAGKNESM
jgi:hypothetical protein